MTKPFVPVTQESFNSALEEILSEFLRSVVASRGLGHCMKILDLDPILMTRLCHRLRAEVPNGEVFILSNDSLANDPSVISGSKLVELRNPLPDGTLRQPLLVFVPSQLKIASEDSFGVATFEQISCGHVYGQLT